MADDLIGTADVANILGVSVATVNRWGAEGSHDLQVALELDGPKRVAARLYRRSEVIQHRDRRIAAAIERGACPNCTTYAAQHFHGSDPCPMAVAS